MKAALEASYHAGEPMEPDWVREERALHKVDDQMARDVKSEATKSCNLRVLALAAPIPALVRGDVPCGQWVFRIPSHVATFQEI